MKKKRKKNVLILWYLLSLWFLLNFSFKKILLLQKKTLDLLFAPQVAATIIQRIQHPCEFREAGCEFRTDINSIGEEEHFREHFSSDVDPDWLLVDPDPQNLMKADPDQVNKFTKLISIHL